MNEVKIGCLTNVTAISKECKLEPTAITTTTDRTDAFIFDPRIATLPILTHQDTIERPLSRVKPMGITHVDDHFFNGHLRSCSRDFGDGQCHANLALNWDSPIDACADDALIVGLVLGLQRQVLRIGCVTQHGKSSAKA